MTHYPSDFRRNLHLCWDCVSCHYEKKHRYDLTVALSPAIYDYHTLSGQNNKNYVTNGNENPQSKCSANYQSDFNSREAL